MKALFTTIGAAVLSAAPIDHLPFVFTFFSLKTGLIVDPVADQEHRQTGAGDHAAQRKVPVVIGECHLVETLRKVQTHHGVANQHGLYRLTVHRCLPVSVLGDGGVENAVPVTGDGSLNPGIFKRSHIQSGRIQDLISLPENCIINHGGAQINGAALVGGTAEADLHLFAGGNGADAEHLGQGIALGVQSGLAAVEINGEIVPLALIQVEAEQTVLVGDIVIADISGFVSGLVCAVAGLILRVKGQIVSYNSQAISGENVEGVLGDTGGSRHQIVLELEAVAVIGKVEVQ